MSLKTSGLTQQRFFMSQKKRSFVRNHNKTWNEGGDEMGDKIKETKLQIIANTHN